VCETQFQATVGFCESINIDDDARVIEAKLNLNVAPVKSVPARRQVTEIHRLLRERICLLRYPPATLLSEKELAGEFNVSRTPIRQVLQRLEYEGLVETRNGIGTHVTGVDIQEFQEIYALRLRLSELIGEFGSYADKERDLRRIETLIDRRRCLTERPNVEEFWMINHELHFIVNGLIKNSALRDIHDKLYFQASRVWYSVIDCLWDEEVEFLGRELDEIRRALFIGDIRAVGFVQRNYISYGLARITKSLAT
jgi:DNA-binding GntR family transcriptional regulator